MPTRLTAQDFDQDVLILFDAYVHGALDRRGFLNQAQKYAKAGITAAGLLAALSPDFAAWWPQHDVAHRLAGRKRLNHPAVGDMRFFFSTLTVGDRPGLKLCVFTALDEEDTPAKLARLLAATGGSPFSSPAGGSTAEGRDGGSS